MAQELGLFEKYGVKVVLSRELGWATIRDKVIYGELEAAHAPAGLPVAVTCGVGTVATDCITGMVLSLHGNAITLSQWLWKQGVRDGATLREFIRESGTLLTFGVAYRHSSHNVLMRSWLLRHRIHPDRDVQIVVVPPAQMHGNLKAGHLDGYCVGEPWNSFAVLSRTGWIVETSAELAPGHPEKVLMMRRDFADRSKPEHLALMAALTEACRFCDDLKNHERIVETLASSEFVDASVQAVRASLAGHFDYGNGRVEKTGRQHVFFTDGANEPSAEKARWVSENLISSGAVPDASLIPIETAIRCFRPELFQQATQLITS
jgi:ABC-type nitrate/sulfonate/bicarbonate transport system substrate-binding protein